MQTQRHRSAANPFAMMLDPQAVLAKLAKSDRLERLERRICRPLDKPLIGQISADDAAIDNDASEMVEAGDDGVHPTTLQAQPAAAATSAQ